MTIADLIMQRGQIAARGAERSGAIWGNAVANLGQIAAGAIQQHGMQKQAQERQVAFDEALQSWDPADPNQSFMRLARVAGPEPAMQITRGLMAITESQQRQAQGEAPDPELFGQKIGGLLAMRDKMGPDYLRERWDQIQPHFAPDVKALFGVELGPEYTEEYDQQLTALGEQFGPQPQGGDFTLSPGQTRFGPEGEQIAAVPAKPAVPASPNIGTFERYVVDKYGPNASPDQQARARREWAAMAREPKPSPGAAEASPWGTATTDTERKRITAMRYGLKKIPGLKQFLKKNPDVIGPLEGRMTKFRQKWGVRASEEIAKREAELAVLRNAIVNALSGVAVNPQEFERLKEQIPNIEDSEQVFKGKMVILEEYFQDNLRAFGLGAPSASAVQAPPGMESLLKEYGY
jgi:hypothetical protein